MRKFYILISGLFIFFSAQSQTQTVEFTATGNQTFTIPCGVTQITVEAWGGGGRGGQATSNGARAGGGSGGAYTKGTFNVTPGNTYNLHVGEGGSGSSNNAQDGTDSWFWTTNTLRAKGGKGAARVNNNSAGTGAAAVTSGNVNTGNGVVNIYGAAGSNASSGRSGNGGNGGNGGAGGQGVSGNNHGNAGLAPGGGGSGGYRSSNSNRNGGAGGNGKVKITYVGISADYCSINYSSTRPITLVRFAGIDNRTSAATNSPGYEQFCSPAGAVNLGATYSVRLEGNTNDWYWFGIPFSNNHDYYTVFIDWNQDGDFVDSGERFDIGVINQSDGNDGKYTSGNITVPNNAKLGSTRMRVVKNYDGYVNNSCGTKNNSGQVEDYIIEVSGGCQQPTGATVNDLSSLTVCENTTVTLRQTGGNLGPNQQWKWYAGSPSGTLVGSSNANDASLQITPSITATYYVRAEGGTCGSGGQGKTVTVTVNKTAGISLTSGNQHLQVCVSSGAITSIVYSINGGANNAGIVSGSLPNGLAGSYSNGKFTISGTPAQTGTFNYTVSPMGNAPCVNATISGTITVLEQLSGLSYSNMNTSYCVNGNITPNTPSLVSGAATSYSVSPSLPTGLNINPTTGVISGTPAVVQSPVKYVVTASNGQCSTSADIYIEVSSTTAQAFSLSNAGLNEICSTGGSVNITLSGSESGKNYQLYKDGSIQGAPKSGNGNPIDFGNYNAAGNYIVRTTDACATQMNGTVTIQVTQQPNTDFSYSQNSYCILDGMTGPATLTGHPQTGIFTAPGGVVFADNTTGEIDLTHSIPGTYTITYTVAAGGGCGVYTKTHNVKITASAQVFHIIGGGAYCDGDQGPEIKLDGSVVNVGYQLYREGSPVGSVVPGSGGQISFGLQSQPGYYTVMATGTGICETEMEGEVQVVKNPKPAQVVVTGSSSPICQSVVLPLKATAGTPIKNISEVTFSSTNPGNITIPDNNAQGIYIPITVMSVPSGAVIEDISLYFKITGGRGNHLRINLKGPNGNVLNIANALGGNNAVYRNGTTISSTATNNISSATGNPWPGTYAPQGALNVDGATLLTANKSNVTNFGGLYNGTSVGVNGNWMLSIRDISNNQTSTFDGVWTLKIKYSVVANPVNVVWSTNGGLYTDLYTDPGGEKDFYYGESREMVYLSPSTSGAKLYTATATNEYGCSTAATTTVNVNPAPVLTVQPDYCSDIANNNIVITATSDINVRSNSWQWSGYDQNVSNGNRSSVIKTKTAGTFYVSAVSSSGNGCAATASMSVAQELVVNGNFEDEFSPGQFETGYTYVNSYYNGNSNSGLYPEGTYTVDRDPNNYHSNFWGTDHTLGNGQGKFLIVNGVVNSNTTIWKQTVNVTPNTTYYFSAWAVALNNDGNQNAQANLRFSVNNGQVGSSTGHLPVKAANNESGNWVRFYGTWNSGSSTQAIIEIVNLTPNAGGNDFGLDDISFGTLSTFFNLTSDENSTDQKLCEVTPMTTISFEAGGKGVAPSITWTSSTPGGIDPYWNGRDFLLRGMPNTPGTFNYEIKLEVCDEQFLTKTGTIEIRNQSDPGNFKNVIGNTIPVCYNSPGTIELENTHGGITKWQRSSDLTNWTNVSNTTTEYNYSNITDPLYLRAYAKQDGSGCVEKVSEPVKLAFRNMWEGNSGAGWNTANNWSFSTVPATGCDYVVIPDVGSKPYPVLNGSAQVHHLIMKDNTSLTVSNTGSLVVSGNITTGTNARIDATDGTLEFNGDALQQISSGMFKDTTIRNLRVSNHSAVGLQVSSSGSSLAVTDKISFGDAGGTLNSGDNITLKSGKLRTASLGELKGSSSVSGKFTVERYINSGKGSGEHDKKWLFLATPATGQTIKQSWMEGSISNASTGYGIQLTGPQKDGNWDMVSPAPSIKYYNPATNLWVGASSADANLYNPNGWMTFVRGDRSVDGIANTTANQTTLRSKGTLKTGVQTFPVPADPSKEKFYAIGNPYASAIDMARVSNVDEFYVWDPYATGDYGLGAYVTYTKVGNEFLKVPTSTGEKNNYILSGQAFFVQQTPTARTITINESSKGDTSANTSFFRPMGTSSTLQMLRTNIFNNGFLEDGTLHIFAPEYSNSVDAQDARKMLNSGVNLSVKVENKLLAVERKRTIDRADTIFFNLTGTVNGRYNFEFDARSLNAPGLDAWLEDAFANSQTPLNLDGKTDVQFDVTASAASKAADRFRIVFKPANIMPVTFVKVKAAKDGDRVNVRWSVAQEINVSKYVVMKSTDGNQFKDMDSIGAAGVNDYVIADKNPADGYNYYRIRSVDIDGGESYSEIVKIFMGSAEPVLRVFPNPVANGNINLRLENYPAGTYQIRLINPGGQVMLTRVFNHTGGNYTEKIPWDYKFAHGNYNLEVRHPDGSIKIIVVMY